MHALAVGPAAAAAFERGLGPLGRPAGEAAGRVHAGDARAADVRVGQLVLPGAAPHHEGLAGGQHDGVRGGKLEEHQVGLVRAVVARRPAGALAGVADGVVVGPGRAGVPQAHEVADLVGHQLTHGVGVAVLAQHDPGPWPRGQAGDARDAPCRATRCLRYADLLRDEEVDRALVGPRLGVGLADLPDLVPGLDVVFGCGHLAVAHLANADPHHPPVERAQPGQRGLEPGVVRGLVLGHARPRRQVDAQVDQPASPRVLAPGHGDALGHPCLALGRVIGIVGRQPSLVGAVLDRCLGIVGPRDQRRGRANAFPGLHQRLLFVDGIDQHGAVRRGQSDDPDEQIVLVIGEEDEGGDPLGDAEADLIDPCGGGLQRAQLLELDRSGPAAQIVLQAQAPALDLLVLDALPQRGRAAAAGLGAAASLAEHGAAVSVGGASLAQEAVAAAGGAAEQLEPLLPPLPRRGLGRRWRAALGGLAVAGAVAEHGADRLLGAGQDPAQPGAAVVVVQAGLPLDHRRWRGAEAVIAAQRGEGAVIVGVAGCGLLLLPAAAGEQQRRDKEGEACSQQAFHAPIL